MKKKYITPTADSFQLEIENICNAGSPTVTLNTEEDESDFSEEGGDTEFAAGAYRSNLWSE